MPPRQMAKHVQRHPSTTKQKCRKAGVCRGSTGSMPATRSASVSCSTQGNANSTTRRTAKFAGVGSHSSAPNRIASDAILRRRRLYLLGGGACLTRCQEAPPRVDSGRASFQANVLSRNSFFDLNQIPIDRGQPREILFLDQLPRLERLQR